MALSISKCSSSEGCRIVELGEMRVTSGDWDRVSYSLRVSKASLNVQESVVFFCGRLVARMKGERTPSGRCTFLAGYLPARAPVAAAGGLGTPFGTPRVTSGKPHLNYLSTSVA